LPKNRRNATSVSEVRSTSAHLFVGMWRPLASVITTLYYVAIIFSSSSVVWYRALSLRYECIRSSDIMHIP